jgi:hypothetical protein
MPFNSYMSYLILNVGVHYINEGKKITNKKKPREKDPKWFILTLVLIMVMFISFQNNQNTKNG